jgi:hypothetical protein
MSSIAKTFVRKRRGQGRRKTKEGGQKGGNKEGHKRSKV